MRYYHTNEYLTSDEREAALSEWGILKVEVLQRKQLNKDLMPYEFNLLRTPYFKRGNRKHFSFRIDDVNIHLYCRMRTWFFPDEQRKEFDKKSNAARHTLCEINVDRTSIADFDPVPVFNLWVSQGPKHVDGGYKLKGKQVKNINITLSSSEDESED